MADGRERLPGSLGPGDTVDFESELANISLFVELPFWLMVAPGSVEVTWSDATFTLEICPPWEEVFGGAFTDSRGTCLYNGPIHVAGHGDPAEGFRKLLKWESIPVVARKCRTVLKLAARAHSHALRRPAYDDTPRAWDQQAAYWASLCEAHIPVVNELLRRYRLLTYDPFACDVTSWDVPVWYVQHAGGTFPAVLLPYKSLDAKPVTMERSDRPGDLDRMREPAWTTVEALSEPADAGVTPGEFELLDARALLERGDYTGAIRCVVSAIEAVVDWALGNLLAERHGAKEAARRLRASENDFPGRLTEWRKLAKTKMGDGLFREFQATRTICHEIVHLGRRLTFEDRELAHRAVDTGRWLYDLIEDTPARTQLREAGAMHSGGGIGSTFRFPATVGSGGIVLGPIGGHPSPAAGSRRT